MQISILIAILISTSLLATPAHLQYIVNLHGKRT